jgi:hypothetical protein
LIRGRLESGEREKTEPWFGKKSMNPCCVVVTEVRGSLRVLILHKGKEQGRRRRRRRRRMLLQWKIFMELHLFKLVTLGRWLIQLQ